MAAEKTKLNVAQDSNEIPTAIPMISRSGNPIRLLQRMPYVRKREKSKMAAINGK